jgi:putative transposase
VLELSKLRRENEALLSIIGSLVAESKLGKKSAKKKAIVKHFSSSVQMSRKSVAGKSAVTAQVGVSRQNIYYQPRLPAKDFELKTQIEAVISEHKAYGYRRIAIALRVNHKRVHRVMKLFGLKARRSLNRQPKVRSSRDLSSANRHQNLFAKAVVNKPNQAWVSDFTYLPQPNSKFVYLATVLDAYTREIIGWNFGVRHNSQLVTEALRAALGRRSKPSEIFHSDQGSEYCSKDLNEILIPKNIQASMSAKSSPWQNGKQESFTKSLSSSLAIQIFTKLGASCLKLLQFRFTTTTTDESTLH